MKYFALVFTLILIVNSARSLEKGCQLKPSQLNDFGTEITKIVDAQDRTLPAQIPIQSEFEIKYRNGVANYYGTFEGFFRPQEDNFFSVVPVPILGFDVTKERIVIYICAHYTEDPSESHMTVYFLRGYHIDPMNKRNFVGDLFFSPSLKVKPVPASLIGISEVRKFFLQIFRFIPFVDLYFEAWSVAQSFFGNLLGDVTGFGVERIELTPSYFKVSSGVNLASPREAKINRTFQLKRPNLRDGASKKSLKGPDDKVLSDLDSADVEYEEIP